MDGAAEPGLEGARPPAGSTDIAAPLPCRRSSCGPEGDILLLRHPGSWIDRHALTDLDLRAEAMYLERIGIRLEVERLETAPEDA